MDPEAPSGGSLTGGHLLAAISTSIVGMLHEHYGRGPMKAKTYALDDIIVVVMRGSGFTRARADDHGQRRARSRDRHARGLPAHDGRALQGRRSKS